MLGQSAECRQNCNCRLLVPLYQGNSERVSNQDNRRESCQNFESELLSRLGPESLAMKRWSGFFPIFGNLGSSHTLVFCSTISENTLAALSQLKCLEYFNAFSA